MNSKFKTIITAVLLFGMASMVGGCSKEGEPQPVPSTSQERELSFVWDEILLGKGAEHDLSVFPKGFEEDLNVILQNLVWKSNDTTLVIVNENGKVHALSAGNTTISASYNNVTGTCSIRVSDGYDIKVPEEITLRVGETKTVDSESFSSNGGCYYFDFEMNDNSYYACLPLVSIFGPQYQYIGSGGEQHSPEYKYSGLTLIGKHEGSTHLRIYNTEIDFDTLIPVTVLP